MWRQSRLLMHGVLILFLALPAARVHDQDLFDPTDALVAAPEGLVINELDSDSLGTDTLESVELYDGGGGNTSLTGMVLVLWNGNGDVSYSAFDLDGYTTDAAGYFVLGNSGVAGVDLVFSNGLLQNGPDAAALYAANASEFPNGTAVTTANLVDAIVYDTGDADDPGLLVLLNTGEPQANEDSHGTGAAESSQRCPNGSGGGRNTRTYMQAAPTAGAGNLCIETAPYVVDTVPANGANSVALAANVTVGFSESVSAPAAAFDLQCSKSGNHPFSLSGGPITFVLDPDSDLVACDSCVLTVLASQVTDWDGVDPPDTMAADLVGHFGTSCACNSIPIIQGSGAYSPCEGLHVTLSGCVTGVTATGFYMQDLTGDGDPATSDGIYVYMYSWWTNPQGIQAGHSATATSGEVQEYYDATELYSPSTVSKGAACTRPAPVAVAQIATLGPHNVDQYEPTEFMRVSMDIDGHVQGPTERYVSRLEYGDPELGFVKWGLEGSLPNPPRLFQEDYPGYGGLNYLSGATNKNLTDVDFGDRIQGTGIVGVMGYHFDKWQLVIDELLTQGLTVTDDADPPDVEAPLADRQFSICEYNVENMFDWIDDGDGDSGDWQPPDQATYDRMLEKRAKGIAQDLQGCTVVGLAEMEGKDQVWIDLVAKINTYAAAGQLFQWDYYESQDVRDIAVGVVYDANRLTLLSSTQRQGCTAVDYGVSYGNAQGRRVVPNPCGAGTYPLHDRPPYVATLQVGQAGGPAFTMVVNHFKSMSGGAAETRPRREAQAAHNAALALEHTATNPNWAMVGDLNDAIGSPPIAILDSALTFDGQPLVNVHAAHIPKPDQYTYNFSGESEVLDYVFLSKAFRDAYFVAASPMHINADYPSVKPMDEDNCPGGTCGFERWIDDGTSRHASDHDPVFVRFEVPITLVELSRFEARAAGAAVVVEWETAREIDNEGWWLERSGAEGGPYARLNGTLIPSGVQGGLGGAAYTWWDGGVQPEVTYYYRLEAVDTAGQGTPFGPVSAAGGHGVWLPLVSRR